MTTPPIDIVLMDATGTRALELTLDSLLGQTESRFRLFAARDRLSAAGAALLVRYGDARFFLCDDLAACLARVQGPHVCLPSAGDMLAPRALTLLSAALAAGDATMALCDSTFFDGETLLPVAKLPPGAGDCAAALQAGFAPPRSAMMVRWDRVQAAGIDVDDAGRLCRVLGVDGRVVVVPLPLVVVRVPAQSPPMAHPPRRATRLYGHHYSPADIDAERPPTLHVVVDTEAEFDWGQPFATDLTAVSAMAGIGAAQAIFDRYGLRPVYVVDYPVASQPDGVAAIRPIADRGGCAVGAHLHPWANPPFGEDTSRRLSFPGNLPRALEAAKLDALLTVIGENFATTPPFYKAGRYGLGPNTAALIAARGAHVDYSLLPQTDLRRQDGPDFSAIDPIPYRVDGLGLLALPMTRAHVGILSGKRGLHAWLDGGLASALHVPGALARSGLLERLTLTPEGVPATAQIRLVQALLAQGQRLFVLHYHSPSLVAGHTPYVRTEADRLELLAGIDTVCRWFFEELGGLPGRPWDLLAVEERSRP